MKKTLLLAALSALMFAACSSNDTDSSNETTINPNIASTNIVASFANGTSMKVGTPSLLGTATRGLVATRATVSVATNEAGSVTIGDAPSVPSDALTPDNFNSWELGKIKNSASQDNGWQGAAPVVVKNGETLEINSSTLYADIYVENGGVVNITNLGNNNNKTIYVLEGGKLNYNSDNTIDRLTIKNWGTFTPKTTLSINQSSAFYTVGDIDISGKLENGNIVYVGGNLTANNFNNYGSNKTHVAGDLTFKDTGDILLATNSTELYVGGKLTGNSFNISGSGKVYVGCTLTANNKLYLSNSGQLQAEHVYSPVETKIDGGNMFIAEGGQANLGNLNIADVSNAHIVVNAGNALLQTNRLYIGETTDSGLYDLNKVIDQNFYVNYTTFATANNDPAEINHDYGNNIRTSLVSAGINVATAKPANELECGKVGYTTPSEVEPSTPGTEPATPSTPGTEPTTPTVTGGDKVTIAVPDLKEELKLEADDFAIRIDGDYVKGTIVNNNNNIRNYKDVIVSESGLAVSVENLANIPEEQEYTYEVWLWIKGDSWNNMSATEQAPYRAGTDKDVKPTGYDENKYAVRSNVFFGLGGQEDTPYVKVSLHINKKPATTTTK